VGLKVNSFSCRLRYINIIAFHQYMPLSIRQYDWNHRFSILVVAYTSTLHHHNFLHPVSKLLKTFSATTSLNATIVRYIHRISPKKTHVPSFPPLVHRELEMNPCKNPRIPAVPYCIVNRMICPRQDANGVSIDVRGNSYWRVERICF
jgi:hypothetical protein